MDQADGVRTMPADGGSTSALALDGLVLEGEGVSPVAVSPNDNQTEILIPYTRAVNKTQNITIANPLWAALALKEIGSGHVSILFDRQPMWNNGPGSDIEEEDNKEILRRMINFLAESPATGSPVPPAQPASSTGFVSPIVLLLLGEQE